MGQIPKRRRKQLQRLVGDLQELNASEADVRSRAEMYRLRFPNARITPEALVKHWPTLDATVAEHFGLPTTLKREEFDPLRGRSLATIPAGAEWDFPSSTEASDA